MPVTLRTKTESVPPPVHRAATHPLETYTVITSPPGLESLPITSNDVIAAHFAG